MLYFFSSRAYFELANKLNAQAERFMFQYILISVLAVLCVVFLFSTWRK
jgi:hypothetical protein